MKRPVDDYSRSCASWSAAIRFALALGLLLAAGCCPRFGCEYAFETNWEGRHRFFVYDLNLSVGRPFHGHNTCLIYGSCVPHTLDFGVVRYTIVDYPKWMKGCTYWYDVDGKTDIVMAVGY